ncbi:MAG: hypothetical protein KDL31_08140 [Kiritimatiellae bacterium]|nr:hypothetical protein [Kiritimatiellia bacterium]MCB1101291.1 hypothetical protein [Kiritimatiellia bacterium]
MKSTLSWMLDRSFGRYVLSITLHMLRALCPSDPVFVGLVARWFRGRLPCASFMLDHYSRGAGTELEVDGARLMQDAGFLSRWGAVMQGGDAPSGRFEVPQWHLDSLDLRCALGSFEAEWRRESDGYSLCLAGDYVWRPGDHRRPTAALHRAAAALPGAAAFRWRAQFKRIAVPSASSWMPRDLAYM